MTVEAAKSVTATNREEVLSRLDQAETFEEALLVLGRTPAESPETSMLNPAIKGSNVDLAVEATYQATLEEMRQQESSDRLAMAERRSHQRRVGAGRIFFRAFAAVAAMTVGTSSPRSRR